MLPTPAQSPPIRRGRPRSPFPHADRHRLRRPRYDPSPARDEIETPVTPPPPPPPPLHRHDDKGYVSEELIFEMSPLIPRNEAAAAPIHSARLSIYDPPPQSGPRSRPTFHFGADASDDESASEYPSINYEARPDDSPREPSLGRLSQRRRPLSLRFDSPEATVPLPVNAVPRRAPVDVPDVLRHAETCVQCGNPAGLARPSPPCAFSLEIDGLEAPFPLEFDELPTPEAAPRSCSADADSSPTPVRRRTSGGLILSLDPPSPSPLPAPAPSSERRRGAGPRSTMRLLTAPPPAQPQRPRRVPPQLLTTLVLTSESSGSVLSNGSGGSAADVESLAPPRRRR